MKITGTMINYYFVCHRKLWLHVHRLSFEEQHENVQLGKLLDQSSYTREKKQIMIDETVNIDFLQDWKIIHEVKKSKSMEESAEWQVRYYISYLRKKGIAVERGILDYPLLKKRKEILLNDEEEEKLKDILLDIEYISNQENAPATINKKWCKKCAFYEYCFS
ncbi:CRISPR-associated protein Cas4 [Enterococcus saccharolyticus]|uniref:CRISPR-associated exonuclease Cas4 n=1 Tax=Enterococcus saccharolyticus subsp. saccharolyticus ATCC 43076 TaxID=1139996 RepID=S0NUF0_9ENTE|nr:CRISPR-associated protein Cas4 [Enterococcus saccharolyticus]EOT28171.1 CRISPR-associated protein cas4 [Enterococcus saccharolyticus subsp. saccharolyticus ATCC 43076]EOT81525.1 CRISPR-associated protein cas4 [Enterococcus saccharolyticus subsp. saccharolyticus ATCC 43076]OJG87457.1 CRISPR-associated protein cas4 [Enterococcus saccharolyticus]